MSDNHVIGGGGRDLISQEKGGHVSNKYGF
jgi:hypothetical protein